MIVVSAKAGSADEGGHARGRRERLRDEALRPDEVAARIHAVLRRAAGASAAAGAGGVCPDDEALVHRDLRLDVARRRVTLGDAEVALTAHEFDILHVLMGSPDKVFSRELLYELVWKKRLLRRAERRQTCMSATSARSWRRPEGRATTCKTVWGIGLQAGMMRGLYAFLNLFLRTYFQAASYRFPKTTRQAEEREKRFHGHGDRDEGG